MSFHFVSYRVGGKHSKLSVRKTFACVKIIACVNVCYGFGTNSDNFVCLSGSRSVGQHFYFYLNLSKYVFLWLGWSFSITIKDAGINSAKSMNKIDSTTYTSSFPFSSVATHSLWFSLDWHPMARYWATSG